MSRRLVRLLLATVMVAGCAEREKPRESSSVPPQVHANRPTFVPSGGGPQQQVPPRPIATEQLVMAAHLPLKNTSRAGVVTTTPPTMAPPKRPALPPTSTPRTITPRDRFRYWWWKKRHTQLQQRLDLTARMDLIFVGDSLTHYWELEGKHIWAAYFERLRAFNFGSGGDRTQHILYRLKESRFGHLAPKVAVVMAGTNNLDVGDSPQDTVLGIKAIVMLLQKRFTGISVIVLGILPRGLPRNRVWRNARRANRLLAALRRPGAVYVLDMESAFAANARTKRALYAKDRVHLTSKGYGVLGRAIKPLVLKLLKKRPGAKGSVS